MKEGLGPGDSTSAALSWLQELIQQTVCPEGPIYPFRATGNPYLEHRKKILPSTCLGLCAQATSLSQNF